MSDIDSSLDAVANQICSFRREDASTVSIALILAHGVTDAEISILRSLSIIGAASLVSLGLLIFSKKVAAIVAALTILAAVASLIYLGPPQLLRLGKDSQPPRANAPARVIESHAVCAAPALLTLAIAMASWKRSVPRVNSKSVPVQNPTADDH